MTAITNVCVTAILIWFIYNLLIITSRLEGILVPNSAAVGDEDGKTEATMGDGGDTEAGTEAEMNAAGSGSIALGAEKTLVGPERTATDAAGK